MKVTKSINPDRGADYTLVDDQEQPIQPVAGFLCSLRAQDRSPNTISAYAYDLKHFFTFLQAEGLEWDKFTAQDNLRLLKYLQSLSSSEEYHRLSPVRVYEGTGGEPERRLSPATVNRTLAAISTFYEYVIVSGKLRDSKNPIRTRSDSSYARVRERTMPFIGRASNRPPSRKGVGVKSVLRVPRPMKQEQIECFFSGLKRLRDQAAFLLMLEGGLRPGEVLNLKLEDVQYERRRVIIRYSNDHPKGARTKSRQERVVDLHEEAALQTLSVYVMTERPRDAQSTFVFLVGGKRKRRLEPLSYDALVRLFARTCDRKGIRQPWMTPHALRHTHATRMWEGGMRELALQKRLGHASPDSTRVYTRVSDAAVVAEYRRALGSDKSGESK